MLTPTDVHRGLWLWVWTTSGWVPGEVWEAFVNGDKPRVNVHIHSEVSPICLRVPFESLSLQEPQP